MYKPELICQPATRMGLAKASDLTRIAYRLRLVGQAKSRLMHAHDKQCIANSLSGDLQS